MSIREGVRRESYEKTNKTVTSVCARIYGHVREVGPISAWQLAAMLGRPVYTVRPRLTELCAAGKIKEHGVRWEESTKRNETVWDVADKQGELFHGQTR